MYELQIPPYVSVGCGIAEEKLVQTLRSFQAEHIAVFLDCGVLRSGSADKILERLQKEFTQVGLIRDMPVEPDDRQVRQIFEKAKNLSCQAAVAIGGGSVLDTAKMVAVMLNNPGYYEDLTDKEKILSPGVPLIAVPTSAGTGSEATPNAIVLLPEQKLKVGVVHEYFMPTRVILDAALTRTLPASVTAATGLDAFCHCIETYISRKATPISRLFSLRGLELISKYIRRAYYDGTDMEARENMLLAAFFGGVAITCSSTVAVHALSYPLGGSYRIPHGVSNAIVLPHILQYNADAITPQIEPIAGAMGITGEDRETLCRKVVEEVWALCKELGIPEKLAQYGISEEDLESLTVSASGVRRLLDQNPKEMSLEDIRGIYKKLL